MPDPDRGGVHFNIHNNVWNTNYALWYPFDEADDARIARKVVQCDLRALRTDSLWRSSSRDCRDLAHLPGCPAFRGTLGSCSAFFPAAG